MYLYIFTLLYARIRLKQVYVRLQIYTHYTCIHTSAHIYLYTITYTYICLHTTSYIYPLLGFTYYYAQGFLNPYSTICSIFIYGYMFVYFYAQMRQIHIYIILRPRTYVSVCTYVTIPYLLLWPIPIHYYIRLRPCTLHTCLHTSPHIYPPNMFTYIYGHTRSIQVYILQSPYSYIW